MILKHVLKTSPALCVLITPKLEEQEAKKCSILAPG